MFVHIGQLIAAMMEGVRQVQPTMIGGGHNGSGKRHKCGRKGKPNRNIIIQRVRRKHRRTR